MKLPRMSYTFLDTYKRCHRRAHLQYVRKVIDFADRDHRPFIVGIVVDWLFEKWIGKMNFEENWMEDKAEALFYWWIQRRRVVFKGDGDKEKLCARVVKVARLLQEAAFDCCLPEMEETGTKIEAQKKIEYKGEPEFEDFEFFGKLDLWIPKIGAVWDLKVTTQKKYLNRFQLDFFTWLLERTGNEVREMAFLVPELKPSLREVEVNESFKVDFEQELLMLLSDVKNEEEWLPTAKDCWGCPVRHVCEEEDIVGLKVEKKDLGFRIFMGDKNE